MPDHVWEVIRHVKYENAHGEDANQTDDTDNADKVAPRMPLHAARYKEARDYTTTAKALVFVSVLSAEIQEEPLSISPLPFKRFAQGFRHGVLVAHLHFHSFFLFHTKLNMQGLHIERETLQFEPLFEGAFVGDEYLGSKFPALPTLQHPRTLR